MDTPTLEDLSVRCDLSSGNRISNGEGIGLMKGMRRSGPPELSFAGRNITAEGATSRPYYVRVWCKSRKMVAMPRTHFLGCIPVEVGVLALGCFQANVAGVGILVGVSYFTVIFYQIVVNNSDFEKEFERFNIEFSFLLLLFSVLCFIMAIYLIIGVKKRRLTYVLAYYMAGVVTATGLVLLWTKLVFYESYYIFDDVPLSLFISFFIYLPFLSMVHSLYYNIHLQSERENSVKEYMNDICYTTLYKNASNDIEKNMHDVTLQKGCADDIEMDMSYDTLQKDIADDVKKDTHYKTLEEAYADYVKIDILYDILQKDSVIDVKKDITYNPMREESSDDIDKEISHDALEKDSINDAKTT